MMTVPKAFTPSALSKLITPTYARLINAQLVHPANSFTVKPSELHSSLSRPLFVERYEPERLEVKEKDGTTKSGRLYLSASLEYGMIMGHAFFDGNKVRPGPSLSGMYDPFC